MKPQRKRLVAVAQRASAMVHESRVSVSGFARTWVFSWGGPSLPAAFEADLCVSGVSAESCHDV